MTGCTVIGLLGTRLGFGTTLLIFSTPGMSSRASIRGLLIWDAEPGQTFVYLADQGFDSWGVDFSEVAIEKAHQRAADAGVEANFVVGDFTAEEIPGVDGPFDLLIEFGVLDDLKRDDRLKMAATIKRFSRPGSKFLEYCFFQHRRDLLSIGMIIAGMRLIRPGELEALFDDDWEIEEFASYSDWRTEVFLLTRRT